MQVTNSSSPNFSGTFVNTSKMNRIQKRIANEFTRSFSYSDSYVPIKDDVSVYVLPKEGTQSRVEVRVLDNGTDMLYRDKNKKPAIITVVDEKIDKAYESLNSILKQIKDGTLTSTPNHKKVINGKTDLDKIDPELYEGCATGVLKYCDDIGIDKESLKAEEFLKTKHVNQFDRDF